MKTDWTIKGQVIAYCKYLNTLADFGNESVVYKHPDRPNYNVTFKSSRLYKPEWVVYSPD